MKQNFQISLLLMMVVAANLQSHAVNTYYAITTGNWSAATTWSLTSGGSPASAYPTTGDNVVLEGGFAITVDITDAACAGMILGSNGSSGTLLFATSGSPLLTVSGTLQVGGTDNVLSSGKIDFESGAGLIAGNLIMGSATVDSPASIIMTAGGTLTINGSITCPGAAYSTFTGGDGEVIFTANNTLPSGAPFNNFNYLTIGAGTTTLSGDLGEITKVTVKAGATLAMGENNIGFESEFRPVKLNMECGGTAISSITGSGTFKTNGVTVNNVGGGTNGAVIGSSLLLIDLARTFSVEDDGTSAADLTINGTISGTYIGGLTKDGDGTMVLSGANSYTGNTTISGGILKLGAAGDGTNTPLGTANNKTTVSSGAALDLNGFSLSTAEPLTLNGTGISGGGALMNSSTTTATYQGVITLNTAASIVGGDGLIAITGTPVTAATGITLGGSAGGSISSVIAGSRTITKTGTGTWTLSGANSYTGLTSIGGGILKLGAASDGTNTPLGTAAAGTVISSGALDLNGYTLSTTEALSLNGTGISGGGALINSSGTAVNYNGAITLESASSIGTTGDIALTASGIGGGRDLTKVGTGTLDLGSETNTLGALAISAGILTATSGIMSLSGNFSNEGTFTPNNGTVTLDGSTPQTISVSTFNNLTLNNSSGATLTGDATVVGTLAFTRGKITTGTNKVIIGAAGTITGAGTGQYINGNLRRYIANGETPTVRFDIGDGTSYTPASISFVGGTTSGSGYLDAFTTAAQPPVASGLSQTKYINRKWTITNTGVAGFTSYNPTFTFVDGDKVGSPDVSALIIRKLDGSTWSATNVGTRAVNTTQCTSLNTFSEFDIGEQGLDHFTLTLSTPQTNGFAFTGTNTLTALDAINQTMTTFDASADQVTITANAPLTGIISGLSGTNKLNNATDFSAGVANLTTLGLKYSGNAATGTFTATSGTGKSGTSGAITINTAGTWTGATSTNWNTATNWAGGSVPTSATDVIIPDVVNDPVIGVTIQADCNDLNVNSGGNLTIQSSGLGTGSLIVHGTSAGNATCQRYMTGNQWHIVSPTTAGGSIRSFIQAEGNAVPVKNVSGTDNYGMMDYNETGNTWNSYYTSAIADNLNSGKGYSVRRNADGVVTFTGTLTSGTKTISLTKAGEGWNCVGNPYPSAIGMNSGAGTSENFVTKNSGSLDPSYACVYVWDDNSLSYKILGNVSFGGRDLGQNFLQAGQGFFVKAKDNSGVSVQFTAAMQSHQATTALKSAEKFWPGFELTTTTAQGSASTIITFNNAMTTGLDVTYDAGLLRGASGLELYSRLVTDNGVDFAIQCLPESYPSLVIPFGLDCKTGGEVIFSAKTVELPAACSVILEDKMTKTFTSLAGGATYKATVPAGTTGTGRFYIHTNDVISGVSDLPSAATFSLKVYPANREIIIEGEVSSQAKASLFDLNGKKLGEYALQRQNRNTISVAGVVPGVYLLNVTDGRKRFNTKIVID